MIASSMSENRNEQVRNLMLEIGLNLPSIYLLEGRRDNGEIARCRFLLGVFSLEEGEDES